MPGAAGAGHYSRLQVFVLGIDPGLTTTGYAAVTGGPSEPRAVAAGVIRTDPAASLGRRLVELHHDLSAILAEHKPDVVAIQQVFVNLNRVTATSVGRAAGVAILAAAQAGAEVVEYPPTKVKLAVTGDGAADKRQVTAMVGAWRLGLAVPPHPADAADALAVALCHLQAARWSKPSAREAS